MSAKRSARIALPTSTAKIQKARQKLRKMSMTQKIDIMLQAGVLTKTQAQTAKKKLVEMEVRTAESKQSEVALNVVKRSGDAILDVATPASATPKARKPKAKPVVEESVDGSSNGPRQVKTARQ